MKKEKKILLNKKTDKYVNVFFFVYIIISENNDNIQIILISNGCALNKVTDAH